MRTIKELKYKKLDTFIMQELINWSKKIDFLLSLKQLIFMILEELVIGDKLLKLIVD